MTVKKYLLLSILWALLLSSTSNADDLYFLAKHPDYPGKQFRVTLFNEQSCLAELARLQKTDSTISAGLDALNKIMNSKPESPLSCLNEVLNKWDKLLPALPKVKLEEAASSEELPIFSKIDYTKLKELEKKLVCFNPHPEGSANYKAFHEQRAKVCENKWLSKADGTNLAKDLQEEKERIRIENKKAQFEQNLGSSAMAVIKKHIIDEYDDENFLALNEQLTCYDTYEAGSDDSKWFKESREEECKDKWVSKEAAEKINQQIEIERKRIAELNKEPQAFNNSLAIFEEDPNSLQYLGRAGIKELVKTLRCYADPKSNNSLKYIKQEWGWLCGNELSTIEQKNSAEDRIKEIFKDIPKITSEYINHRDVINLASQKKFDAKISDEIQRYAARRLLTRYSFYLNNGGTINQAAEFCRSLEKSDLQDKAYAAAGLTMNYFKTEKDWKVARERGISEAEFSAIYDYADSYYLSINPAIWNNTLTDKEKTYMKVMNSGLAKMPKFNATPVIRFADLPKSVLEQHKVGNTVCYNAYTSTSKDPNWMWDGKKFIVHLAKKGHLIEEISSHTEEQEVLLEPNTCFKVLKKTTVDSLEVFELTEIESDESSKEKP